MCRSITVRPIMFRPIVGRLFTCRYVIHLDNPRFPHKIEDENYNVSRLTSERLFDNYHYAFY